MSHAMLISYINTVIKRCNCKNEIPSSIYINTSTESKQKEDIQKNPIDTVTKTIWSYFFECAKKLLVESDNYTKMNIKEKLLYFYFNLFEIFTINKKYIHQIINDELVNINQAHQLSSLKTGFKEFAKQLLIDDQEIIIKNSAINEYIFTEAAWLHTSSLVKFWITDTSKKQEQTDVEMAKAVNALFAILERSPADNYIAFDKNKHQSQFFSRKQINNCLYQKY